MKYDSPSSSYSVGEWIWGANLEGLLQILDKLEYLIVKPLDFKGPNIQVGWPPMRMLWCLTDLVDIFAEHSGNKIVIIIRM